MSDASDFSTIPVGLHTMDATFFDEQNFAEFGRWLNVKCRCFGDKGDVEDITEGQCIASLSRVHAANIDLADIISTVEFDHTGNYLATGDKGGRVVLFERNESVGNLPGGDASKKQIYLCDWRN